MSNKLNGLTLEQANLLMASLDYYAFEVLDPKRTPKTWEVYQYLTRQLLTIQNHLRDGKE